MFLIFTLLVVAAATLYYINWRQGRKHLYELAEKLPGQPGLPLLGNTLTFALSHNKILETLYEMSFQDKFQDLAKLWLGPRLVVILVNPKDIEIILSSSVHLKKSNEYKFFEPWFGNGLLISNGDTWKTHRKMIAPTFHLNVLKRFMDEFNKNSKCVISRMAKENGKPFDCHDYMSECMVETLLETVMGVKQASKGRNCLTYAMSVMDMCDILHSRQTKLWLRPDFLFRWTSMAKENDKHLNIILNLTNKIFKKKKDDYAQNKFTTPAQKEITVTSEEVKTNEKFSYGQSAGLKDDLDVDDNEIGEKRRLPFLESMIERAHNGDGLTDQEIKNQVNTIMFEGHDTTAAGSSFFLSIMGARQDIQEKCLEEIDEIFGDSDRDVTFQDTLEMKYLERCIMETLRLFPPVPIIGRELEQDIKLASSDLVLPAGCTATIGTFKLHRRPDIYPNPEEFDPDRFLPENSTSRHYYSFIPFSAGPRSCVGRKYAMLKLKILLANILRNFRVKEGKPMNKWKLQADIILKRTDGFEIALENRKHQKAH
ncbi:cytochrome P450 4g15-like [Cimex lectularius]|uniref:Cytochrome P450 n=1 Tax=Cimex lectularius TaxID=79782 RepID=A0A8I6SQY5_CIMLE|nr:cytochrome P450 4g15-like [Cimex lectularius]